MLSHNSKQCIKLLQGQWPRLVTIFLEFPDCRNNDSRKIRHCKFVTTTHFLQSHLPTLTNISNLFKMLHYAMKELFIHSCIFCSNCFKWQCLAYCWILNPSGGPYSLTIMYSVRCTVHSVQSEVYSVQSAVYTVLQTVYIFHRQCNTPQPGPAENTE